MKQDSLWTSETNIFFTGDGFAYVEHGDVVVFVDTAERPEEIDVRRAEEAKERAEESSVSK